MPAVPEVREHNRADSQQTCRHAEARAYIDRNVRERLYVMLRGGILPNEMVRPTSVFYINFVAEGLVRLAAITEMEGGDLWHFRQSELNSILVCPLATDCV